MKTQVIIPLESFPEDVLSCQGEVDSSILGLQEGVMRCTSGVRYDLEAQLFDSELVVRGCAEVDFQMRCERCLNEFPYTLRVESLTLSFQILPEEPSIDITDALREELILALPAYPKCELADKECQIHDIFDHFRLDKAPPSGVDCATPSGDSVWDALDQISGKQTQ